MDDRQEKREEAHPGGKVPAYSDAFYREAPQAHQPSYGYSPAQHFANASCTAEIRKPKHGTARLIAAVCIICALFSIFIGVCTMHLLKEDIPESTDGSAREIYQDFLVSGTEEEKLTLTLDSIDGLAPLTAEEIYETACESMVGVTILGSVQNVFGQSDRETVTGGGIILSRDGYILTNFHVIEEGYETGRTVLAITEDGERYDADVVGVDEDEDIALIHIDADDLTFAVFGDPSEVMIGQRVYAVGNPLGELTYSMTAGILSGLDRSVVVSRSAAQNMIQFDAAVNSGNSGGPLYNEFGQVIGIVTAKYSEDGAQGLSFAIPADEACRIAAELANKGYVSGKPYLGLSLTTVTRSAAEYYDIVQGVYVTAVKTGSAAENAGLLPGDIITAIDDTEVLTTTELVSAVRDGYHAGDSATLTVWRDQEYMAVTVTFDEMLPGSEPTQEEEVLQDSRSLESGEE